MKPMWTKGRAVIYIDRSAEPKGIQYPVGGSLFYNVAEVQELLDFWSSHIQLPGQYALVGCYFDGALQRWLLIVESEDIPLPKHDEEIPRLYPAYEFNNETGKVRIIFDDLKFKKGDSTHGNHR
jgi:hypothetical protein